MKTANTPPRWARALLRWYCSPEMAEEIEGDLEEEFHYQVKRKGLLAARLDYVRSVLGFMKPFAIKRKSKQTKTLPMTLIRHYFTVAIRQVLRNKSFAAINVSGLALGLASCLLIYLWIADEYHIDNFHAKTDRLYNVYMRTVTPSGVSGAYNVPRMFTDSIAYTVIDEAKLEIPEIEGVSFYHAAFTMPWGKAETFRYNDIMHKLEGSRANNDFLMMFDYPVIAGDRNTPLVDRSSIVITRKMASLFFKSPDEAIGKMLRFENALDFQVTAVIEDPSPASSFRFDYLTNWELQMRYRMPWASHIVRSAILLAPGADPAAVEEKLNRVAGTHLPAANGSSTTLGLQRYGDQYLIDNFEDGRPSGGRIEYIRIFTGVGIFILLIACINFMNLATARSVRRAREVGVRKVIGSTRSYLIGQFYSETVLLAVAALVIAMTIVFLSLPMFNDITGKRIELSIGDIRTWISMIGLTVATGLIAGSYPALFLSSLKPVKVLKGVVSFTRQSIWTRKSMAVFQFGLSILLLIATIVMSEQTSFMRNVNLGYDKENLLYFPLEGKLTTYDGYMRFKNAALQLPGVAMVDRSSEAPHKMGFLVDEEDGVAETDDIEDTAIKWEGKDRRGIGFKPTSVGFDFLELMNLEVSVGRGFSKDNATDSAEAFMINEQAVKEMGIEDPIGKWISAWRKKGRIIGILKDYNQNSLHERIRPLIIDVKEYENFGVVMVRTEPGKTDQALASLQALYKELNPDYPFAFNFVDVDNDRMYRSELTMTKLSNIFAALAIAISCLGLLGLIIFSAEQRTREIGIRKALGATVASIISLLSGDFLKIVMIAFVIAVPVSAWLMQNWLDGFAYKISLSWWIFGAAGLAAVGVAFATIAFQAVRSARANPVDSLRSE